MSKRLDRDTVERQISEMWDAVSQNQNEKDYKAAWDSAQAAEQSLRARLRKQDRLDEAGEDMLDALKALYAEIRGRFATSDEVAYRHMSEPLATIMKKAKAEIKKAEAE